MGVLGQCILKAGRVVRFDLMTGVEIRRCLRLETSVIILYEVGIIHRTMISRARESSNMQTRSMMR